MDSIIEILLDQHIEDIYVRLLIKVALMESIIMQGRLVPWQEAIFIASGPTKALLAFTIQKWIDPEKPMDILVGDVKNPGWTLVSDTYDVDEMAGGSNPICSGSLLYDIEPLYRWIPPSTIVLNPNTVESCPLPWGKVSIMKWLYLSRLLNDDTANYMSAVVDEALRPGSNFHDIIMDLDTISPEWKELLILSILKTKAINLANAILQNHIPDTCEVPND